MWLQPPPIFSMRAMRFNAKIELGGMEMSSIKTKLATLMTQNDVTDIFFTWEAGFMGGLCEQRQGVFLSVKD